MIFIPWKSGSELKLWRRVGGKKVNQNEVKCGGSMEYNNRMHKHQATIWRNWGAISMPMTLTSAIQSHPISTQLSPIDHWIFTRHSKCEHIRLTAIYSWCSLQTIKIVSSMIIFTAEPWKCRIFSHAAEIPLYILLVDWWHWLLLPVFCNFYSHSFFFWCVLFSLFSPHRNYKQSKTSERITKETRNP